MHGLAGGVGKRASAPRSAPTQQDDVVHRREIIVQNETDDIFVIKNGVGVGDRIVVEGIRQVGDGEKMKYEFRTPEEVMRKLTNHAE